MSEKNTLRMIFFAILFVVIIGGIYTADYAFAESGERDVTLDISIASSADFKIFDKNEREIKEGYYMPSFGKNSFNLFPFLLKNMKELET